MKTILLSIVYGYRRLGIGSMLAVITGSRCRFKPSCSFYMEESIRRYGTIKGLWIGFGRLKRCHPFSQGGFDPVK